MRPLHGKTKTAIPASGLAAALALAAGIAWACTASAYVQVSPRSGPAGIVVTMSGNQFSPEAAVSIRWNSSSGSELAAADGPQFSVKVPIPADATPGVYYLVAVQTDLQGRVWKTSAAFEVTPVGGPPPGGSGGEATPGTTSGTISAGSGTTGGPASGAPQSPPAGAPAGGAGGGTASPGAVSPGSQTQPVTGPATASGGFSLFDPAASSQTQPGVTGRQPQTAQPRRSQPQAAPPPAARPAPAPNAPAVPVPGDEQAAPEAPLASANSLSGDLWRGFSGRREDSSLTGRVAEGGAGGGAGGMVGAGMLAAGLVAMVAGFALTEVSRRKSGSAG